MHCSDHSQENALKKQTNKKTWLTEVLDKENKKSKRSDNSHLSELFSILGYH